MYVCKCMYMYTDGPPVRLLGAPGCLCMLQVLRWHRQQEEAEKKPGEEPPKEG